MYILVPFNKPNKQDRNLSQEGFSFGSLKSAVGNLNFTGQDGVFNQISKAVGTLDDVNSKYSIVAMTQLMKDGKVGNKEALDYLFTGLAKQLDMARLTLGYQSIQSMKAAVETGDINASQFLTALGSGVDALIKTDATKDINKERAILIDCVRSEGWARQAETADRKVESGETLTGFIHNMPKTMTFSCAFIEGKNYTRDEFEYQINYLIDQKVAVSVVLDEAIYGENLIENCVIINYSPQKDAPIGGFDYSLVFKIIKKGSVETKPIVIEALNQLKAETTVVKNENDEERAEKTEKVDNRGFSKKVVDLIGDAL